MPSGRKINWERRAQMAMLYDQGLTYAEIGRELGVGTEWVRQCLVESHPDRRKLFCRECGSAIVSPAATGHQQPILCRDCAFQPGVPFSDLLRSWRVTAGMTQVELAQAVGMRQARVARLEVGRLEPTWAEAIELFAVLGACWVLRPKEPPIGPQKRQGKAKKGERAATLDFSTQGAD